MYDKHEMEVIQFEENVYVLASSTYGGGGSYDQWSIKPDRSDS